jgi:uncharacterized protein YecA (UPF0149 family)
MPGLPRHLKQLEKELLALGEEAMLIEELDGFIARLLVCPDLIKPGEWLPIVWSRDSTEREPAFDSLDHVNRVLELIMEHYNGVARRLMERPNRYGPLFAVDERNGDILWELWSRASRRPSSCARKLGNYLTPMPTPRRRCAECGRSSISPVETRACRGRTATP